MNFSAVTIFSARVVHLKAHDMILFFFFCLITDEACATNRLAYRSERDDRLCNRPFAQLLSGLETEHPAAAGPSLACDFGVFDKQKAVFLASVLDVSECDSSGLDHLNSMWSNARVREYYRRKIGHSWMARKPSFLNVSVHTSSPPTVHTVYNTSGVSVTVLSAILRVWVWILETQVGLSSERVLEKKKRIHSIAVQESRASWTSSIFQSSPRIHTACTNPVLSGATWKKTKSLLAQTSPELEPLPLAFCQLPMVSDLIICPKDDGGGKHRDFSQCVYVLCTLTWETSAGEKKTPMALHLLSEVSSLPRFQTTGNGSRSSLQAFRHEHDSELFLWEEVLDASDRAVGDAEVRSVNLTNGK